MVPQEDNTHQEHCVPLKVCDLAYTKSGTLFKGIYRFKSERILGWRGSVCIGGWKSESELDIDKLSVMFRRTENPLIQEMIQEGMLFDNNIESADNIIRRMMRPNYQKVYPKHQMHPKGFSPNNAFIPFLITTAIGYSERYITLVENQDVIGMYTGRFLVRKYHGANQLMRIYYANFINPTHGSVWLKMKRSTIETKARTEKEEKNMNYILELED